MTTDARTRRLRELPRYRPSHITVESMLKDSKGRWIRLADAEAAVLDTETANEQSGELLAALRELLNAAITANGRHSGEGAHCSCGQSRVAAELFAALAVLDAEGDRPEPDLPPCICGHAENNHVGLGGRCCQMLCGCRSYVAVARPDPPVQP